MYFAITGKATIAVIGPDYSMNKDFFRSLTSVIPEDYKLVTINSPFESGNIMYDEIGVASSDVREIILQALDAGVQIISLPVISNEEDLRILDSFTDIKLYIKGDTLKVIDKVEILMVTQSGEHHVPLEVYPSQELINKISNNQSPSERTNFESFLIENWHS